MLVEAGYEDMDGSNDWFLEDGNHGWFHKIAEIDGEKIKEILYFFEAWSD